MGDARPLNKYLYLSLGAAVVTLAIKTVAAWLTNSVGLWSDALESTVNLVAAIIAIWALRLSAKPADDNHNFGHGKAEYVSAGVEGSMVFVAAGAIVISAVGRLLTPAPLEQLSFGLILSLSASLVNLAVGLLLVRAGRRSRSITLEADGQHLLTDVATSVGVLIGIGLVLLTGWTILDPIVALLVGLNILITGVRLVRRSVVGLLDSTLPPEEVQTITDVLDGLAGDPRVHITDIKTRESGRQRFVYVTVSVPGHWTVRRSHDVADAVEDAVDATFAGTTTFVHMEPNDEPASGTVPTTG
ncbi:MAG: cation diffusion facilitator family transporter [Propionibacteriaceae bacterium]|nr:cation diffusion facilitator family transporter [Propionibacteriaceae bacterium]